MANVRTNCRAENSGLTATVAKVEFGSKGLRPTVVPTAVTNCRRRMLSLLLSPTVANCCRHCYLHLLSPTAVTTATVNLCRQMLSLLPSPTVANCCRQLSSLLLSWTGRRQPLSRITTRMEFWAPTVIIVITLLMSLRLNVSMNLSAVNHN